jgi:hypothetical protein
MRRIITLASLSLTLLVGGAAMASPRYETRGQERREEVRREERHEQVRREEARERYFDRDHRPVVRYERTEYRTGYRFVGGEWKWNGYEWIWMPGHYIRVRAW